MFFRRLNLHLSACVCEVSKTNLSPKSRKLLLGRVSALKCELLSKLPHLLLHQPPHCASVGSRDCRQCFVSYSCPCPARSFTAMPGTAALKSPSSSTLVTNPSECVFLKNLRREVLPVCRLLKAPVCLYLFPAVNITKKSFLWEKWCGHT